MGLIDILLKSGDGDLVKHVSKTAGLDESSANELLKTLGSAMLGSVKGRVESNRHDSTGLEDLLRESKYANMLDAPSTHYNDPKMKDYGDDLLSHITGSKENSINIANEVAQKTGVSSSLIKSLLPMLAPLIIGTLGKGMFGGSAAPAQAESSGSLLGSLLDFDNDGSVLDDVAGMAMKYLI